MHRPLTALAVVSCPCLVVIWLAGCNGPSPTAELAGLIVNPTSVAGGASAQATLTLINAAPAGGVTVDLASSAPAAVVPASVDVAQGTNNAVFTIMTTQVTASTTATITASLDGSTRTATLRVNPASLVALFTVLSPTRGANACAVVAGGTQFDCTFDATPSTGSPSSGAPEDFLWTYSMGTEVRTAETEQPTFTPLAGCTFLANQEVLNVGGMQFLRMVVRLRVRSASGTISEETLNENVRVFPNNNCGYAF